VASRIAFLMYHELKVPARPVCQNEPGYIHYVVSVSDFKTQMQTLKASGWQGSSVSQALGFPQAPTVALCFDDGCETDLIAAAPILQELGFGATCYVTSGFLGSKGYLSAEQLRSLSVGRFEIGCHSMTHPDLTSLDTSQLIHETAGAKHVLEQILGIPVKHFSCPGGKWNSRTVDAVKSAGFESMATSRPGVNTRHTSLFALTRVPILRGTTIDEFMRICHSQGIFWTQLQERTRRAARHALGDSIYQSLRNRLLARTYTSDLDDR